MLGVGVALSLRRGLDVVVLDAARHLAEGPLANQTPAGPYPRGLEPA
jgi:hypothetical protein